MTIPADTPALRCRRELAKPKYTVAKLLALDLDRVAAHFDMTLDHVKFERERALSERGVNPWEVLRPKASIHGPDLGKTL